MSKPNGDWSEYYAITKSKPPSRLLATALGYVQNRRHAIDIGGGALKNTRYLLQEGFEVTVVDSSSLMKQEADTIDSDKLHPYTSTFETFTFEANKYDIAVAMSSLPFIAPKDFNEVWQSIKHSLAPQGIFCGNFFGINDDWANNTEMTFHRKAQVEQLLSDFTIHSFEEVDQDATTADGTPKHWHLFNVIAQKR